MNKDFLPFYNSLTQEEKDCFLEFSKEELIDHFIANLKNSECLLNRINKALEFCEAFKKKFRYDLLKHCHLDEIMDILKGVK